MVSCHIAAKRVFDQSTSNRTAGHRAYGAMARRTVYMRDCMRVTCAVLTCVLYGDRYMTACKQRTSTTRRLVEIWCSLKVWLK